MRRAVVSAALLACRPGPTPPATAPVQEAPAPEVVVKAPEPVAAPVSDRDGDTIADAQDRCPEEPEDLDLFEDEDGCADRDNDQDRIPDAHEFNDGRWTNCDRRLKNGVEVDCRNMPEDYDGIEDHDGCPDYLCLDQCQIRLSDRVRLDARGRFIADASKVFDEVAETMRAAPDISLWVEAHVDPRRDRAAAKRLTQQAAAAAIEEVIRRGIDRSRLEPIGWGGEKPIDRKTSAQGRANNRRVEFNLRECGCNGWPLDPDVPQSTECR